MDVPRCAASCGLADISPHSPSIRAAALSLQRMSRFENYSSSVGKYHLPFYLVLRARCLRLLQHFSPLSPPLATCRCPSSPSRLLRTHRTVDFSADCNSLECLPGSAPLTGNADGSVTKLLENAVSEFGSVLTDDERKLLQRIRGVPDASAALVFTVKLDVSNSTRRRKRMGARTYSMLRSIQQFSAIVEIFISAYPDIAAHV